ncbi:MAG TPA: Holliday junction branch migration DNA helicase RuvB, partial [bacterium]|nr:Holliday junction branch migration DNA helicase RuvB [bacterium]
MRESDRPDRIVSGRPADDEKKSENSLRPSRLAEYIGQDRVKENLEISIKAALERGEPLD